MILTDLPKQRRNVPPAIPDSGVYNLPNKTRNLCGKISENIWENVEAYSKTVN